MDDVKCEVKQIVSKVVDDDNEYENSDEMKDKQHLLEFDLEAINNKFYALLITLHGCHLGYIRRVHNGAWRKITLIQWYSISNCLGNCCILR